MKKPELLAPDEWSRRDFVKLVGASLALAGLSGCVREPDEPILPYVAAPGNLVPGVSARYATSMPLDGYATGLLVNCRDGRPLKVEGNPDHPASLGTAGVYEQASLLQLYDPSRARGCRVGRRRTSWQTVASRFAPAALHRRVGARGAGLRLLLPPVGSPLTQILLDHLRSIYPDAGIWFHAPISDDSALAATRAVLRTPLLAQYDFTAAEVVVSLGADCFASGPFHLRHAHDFGERRRRRHSGALCVAECTPTPTGTLASHRLPVAPDELLHVGLTLLHEVSSALPRVAAPTLPEPQAPLSDAARAWARAVAQQLVAAAGHAIVVAGPQQPPEVHVVAHALNALLDHVGHTVWYTASPVMEAGTASHDVARFAADLDAGNVDTLVVAAVNPCYSAPGALDLARRMRAVPNALYLGDYDDETAGAVTWHVAAAHYLESWGDACAYDGAVSPVQPLIAPMYDGRTVDQVLALLCGTDATAHQLMQRYRSDVISAPVLQAGIMVGSGAPRVTAVTDWPAVAAVLASVASSDTRSVSLSLMPGPTVYDGRFANNPWLQELPDPITKLTWDNAAMMAPALAARAGVDTGDVITLTAPGVRLQAPVLVVPGHADRAVSLAIGYGRRGAGTVSRLIGCDANGMRPASGAWVVRDLRITPTGGRHPLAITQEHWSIEGREAEIFGTTAAPAKPEARRPRPLTLYQAPPVPADGFGVDQWAMTIDLDLCTGCSACVVACQAENNVPVVGKSGVLESREMHWLRIDRYLGGAPDAPAIVMQPMLCQQCEDAPCEYVCPVGATVHSDDGLNEMVYNRCVGTRFCSNNCPYHVRRFNWFDYNADLSEPARMAKNPEVTVRARGVMEKCTFCVQRIRQAQEDAVLAGEPVTGPVVTACQQACPTGAIIFGSLTNPASAVTASFRDPRITAVLDQLATGPRVRYLARQLAPPSGGDAP